MRFSCTNSSTLARPSPSSPTIAEAGTRTSRSSTSEWSLGMFSVQWWNRTSKPGASVGTRKAVIPRGLPASPAVRANTRS